MDEEEVKRNVRRARDDGDLEAFNWLVLKYQETVFNSVWDVGYKTSEDFAQDAFIRAWTKINTFSYRRFPSFRAWLLTIAGNLCRDEGRKQKRMEDQEKEETAIAKAEAKIETQRKPTEDELEKSEREQALTDCMDRLPEKYRAVYEHARRYGMKRREIAHVLGVTVNAVGGRIRRAEKLFLDCLGSRFGDLFPDYCR
ncbi:MAG TPA: sigma-70 family RNA polymerase sigma factor [Anaerolineales bacterium]|jgi:RNA polymerase sigma-70 factor (ECF subfamily)|nr:sigma-70 family RNA polymerase sigma factor [Anaerolineales bacterium]|tara:strand:- start:436 stop:1029 length:594 start_codon:yes stop_codon:yes gene_type:complete